MCAEAVVILIFAYVVIGVFIACWLDPDTMEQGVATVTSWPLVILLFTISGLLSILRGVWRDQ